MKKNKVETPVLPLKGSLRERIEKELENLRRAEAQLKLQADAKKKQQTTTNKQQTTNDKRQTTNNKQQTTNTSKQWVREVTTLIKKGAQQ